MIVCQITWKLTKAFQPAKDEYANPTRRRLEVSTARAHSQGQNLQKQSQTRWHGTCSKGVIGQTKDASKARQGKGTSVITLNEEVYYRKSLLIHTHIWFVCRAVYDICCKKLMQHRVSLPSHQSSKVYRLSVFYFVLAIIKVGKFLWGSETSLYLMEERKEVILFFFFFIYWPWLVCCLVSGKKVTEEKWRQFGLFWLQKVKERNPL